MLAVTTLQDSITIVTPERAGATTAPRGTTPRSIQRMTFSCRAIAALSLIGLAGFATAQDKPEGGFVQLFNGKDLSGWKTHPDDKAKWEVEDGAIKGTGPAGHLFTERDDFTDLVYRIEAKISDKGNSGQYFRVKYAKAFPPGFEAQINSTGSDKVKTGSLYNVVKVYDILVPPNTWFVQEVTAKGNHIVIKVNGKVTVDTKVTDPKFDFTKGHLAIQQHDPGSTVWVRKVEVKEIK
ncbi:MAG: DUF1080 domain-containing protein [Planctomycetota bacterium]|nr:DUF1080 domain-containing protein [Planctomycetota bacterium]